MKAADFHYQKPGNLAEALELLANGDMDAQLLAGGQSLMPMMNFRLAQPELVIDLNGLSELQFVKAEQDAITIGAMTRYSELLSNDLIDEHIPLFAKALPHIAHAAIRNRGTIGGSAALADPAAEMPALLLALDATMCLVSNGSTRQVKADDFFLGIYDTALEPGEMIQSISIPKAKPESCFGFYELARRHGDYAMAGVALAAQQKEPVSGLRIAWFSVSDRACRIAAAEAAFEGKSIGDSGALQQAIKALDGLDFQGDLNADTDTKRHLAAVVLKRALKEMAS